MSKFKGTKEEWKSDVGIAKSPSTGRLTGFAISTDERVICNIRDIWRGMYMPEEALANAKLIAAAPDLLEALLELIFLHNCEQEGLSSGQPTKEQWLKAVEIAEKVINKAL